MGAGKRLHHLRPRCRSFVPGRGCGDTFGAPLRWLRCGRGGCAGPYRRGAGGSGCRRADPGEDTGTDPAGFNQRIGETLGALLAGLTREAALKRVIISGGDTSWPCHAADGDLCWRRWPTIPGASLSRAHADGDFDGLEIALKGGQMGSEDYFGWIRDGGLRG